MQNPGLYKSSDQGHEEEKYGNDGIVNLIAGDYVMDFLAELDPTQRR
jgi:hypothetical protein